MTFTWKRALVVAGLLLGSALPVQAAVKTQCPADNDGIDTDGDGNARNDHVCLHMAAGDGFVKMADGRDTYTFGFTDVTGIPDRQVLARAMLRMELPAPTIAVREGQKLYLTLTNVGMIMRPDLFDPHSVHWHGFANAAPIFDGVPEASAVINMGSSFTYFYNVVEPGTFIWHCHVEASEHMQMGMLGNLFVMPRQDRTSVTFNGRTYTKFAYNDVDGSTGYDVGYPIQLQSFDSAFHDASIGVQPLPFSTMFDDYALLNGRGYPDTINPAPIFNDPSAFDRMDPPNPSQKVPSLMTARRGERILLRLSSLSTTRHFTVRTAGIPMQVVGTGAKLLRGPDGTNLYYETHSLTLGGGETFDVILDTGRVEPGTYFFYTSNLHHLTNGTQPRGGMMTEIVVTP
jgi:FtsP/CotA-like multicopper oxidase with cupredoxin domain